MVVMYVFPSNVINYFFIALLGLVFGSFVSAISYRIPRGVGFLTGRSCCDWCGKDLSWYANIPLLYFIFAKGRSSCCDKKISWRYPLIEIIYGFGFVFLFYLSSNLQELVVHLLIFILTSLVFIIDFENQYIPDELTFLLFISSLLLGRQYLFENIFSGFVLALFLLLIYFVTKGKGMGLGDIKLALPLGFILGIEKGLLFLFSSFLTGGIVAFILLIVGKVGLKSKIAFGPFMILGFWIAYLFIK